MPFSQSEQPLPASREHAVGLVPHQRRAARHRRQPADRRPRHVDDLQGQPLQRQHHLAARRQGLELQAAGGTRADAEQRRRDLRLAARPRGGRARRLHVLRQRVGRRGNTGAARRGAPYSRAVTVKLDPRDRTATLIASDNQPEGLVSALAGQRPDDRRRRPVRRLGVAAVLLRVRPLGQLLFNAQFPAGVNTYRAYLLPWGPGESGGRGPHGPLARRRRARTRRFPARAMSGR